MPDNNPHLRKIVIEGFKSIKSLDLEMNPINILIGANGAGKSNFISLFTFLSELSHGRLKSHVEKNGGANAFFHFGAKNTKNIIIDIKVGFNSYHVKFGHGPFDDTLIFENEYCTFRNIPSQYSVIGKQGESGLLPGGAASSVAVREYTRVYLEGCLVYHFHDTSSSADFKSTVDLYESDYLYQNAGNIAAFLFRLREEFNESYNDIVSCIKTVTPFFQDFYLQPRGEADNSNIILKWLHKDHSVPFSANQLSDGTARFMCLATLFLQPKSLRPDTIILDEPELGLHPAALDVLSELIQVASQTNQVVCSTQSVTFANNFRPEDFIIVDQENGISAFTRPDEEFLKSWIKDYGMGDIWTKNLIGGRPEW